MADSQVRINIAANAATAVAEFGKLRQEMKLTDAQVEASRKAWNNYAVSTGQIGSSLDDFITRESQARNATQQLTAAKKGLANESVASASRIDRLKESVSGLLSSLSGSNKSISGLTSALGGLGGAGGSGKAVSGIGASIAGGLATGFAAALAAGTAVESQFQKIEAAYTTLLGSTEAAAAAMEMIKQDAASTPFDVEGLAGLNLQLTAITGNAQASERILMNFGKAMAAMGRDSNDLNGVMTQVIQVLNKGKLEMSDVKPIQNYIDLYGIMSRNLSISRDELIRLQEQGQLTSDMLLEAFERASNGSGEFAQAYENAAGNLGTSWSNMVEKFKIGLSEFATQTGFFDLVGAAFRGLNSVFENETIQAVFVSIFGTIRVAGTGIVGIIQMIIGAAKSLFSLSWDPFTQSVDQATKNMHKAVTGSFENLNKVFAESVDGNVDLYKQGNSAMTVDNAQKLLKIADQEAQATVQFARQQESRKRSFEQSMRDMIIAHRDKSRSLEADIDKETAAYELSRSKRERAYLEDVATLEERYAEKVSDIEEHLAEERAAGLVVDGVLYQEANQQKIDKLEASLEEERIAHERALARRKQQYAEETTEAQTQHQTRLTQLQTALSEERSILELHRSEVAAIGDAQKADDISRLKDQYALQQQEANRDHAESIARIRRQATEQGLTGGLAYGDALKTAYDTMKGDVAQKAGEVGYDMGWNLAEQMKNGMDENSQGFSFTTWMDGIFKKVGEAYDKVKGWYKSTAWSKIIDSATGWQTNAIEGVSSFFGIDPQKATRLLTGRAGGGPVTAGQPYIVGEREPELFVPRQSGQILNGQQIQQAISGSKSPGVTINGLTINNYTPNTNASIMADFGWEVSRRLG